MSLNLKNDLCKIVTKSQVVTKFNTTKLRLHCTKPTLLQGWKQGRESHYIQPKNSSSVLIVVGKLNANPTLNQTA
jgi:hypothetical protein